MNTRPASSIAFALTLAASAVILAPGDAHGVTGPVTSGSGWKLRPGVTHIDTKPWQITFHDTTSRTKLTGYLRNTAAELTSYLGVQVTVTTRIVPASTSKCLPSHTISYRWMSKPDPAHPNRSFTTPCSAASKPYSASVFINSDYWAPGRNFHEGVRMNVIWNESAHSFGLTHTHDCPTDRYGRKPLLCDVNGYRSLSPRRYPSFEATALKYLRTNRAYYPLP